MLSIQQLSVLLSIAIYCCLADNPPPSTLTIPVIIYDHYPSLNANFECDWYAPNDPEQRERGGVTQGLVASILNSTNPVPTLSPTANQETRWNGLIYDDAAFASFFQDTKGINIEVPYSLVLNLNSDSNTYTFDNQAMFPIDGRGFDALPGYETYGGGHNYHFCMRVNTFFTYQGTEVFDFIGDDDVWVFINRKLVVDIGGVHSASPASVDVKTLGLTVGQIYPFDLFYCERHTSESTIKITTTLALRCVLDYCDVCNGNGRSCCKADQGDCADADLCTVDACPPTGNPDINQDNWRSFCTHTPMVCNPVDKCHTSMCSNGTCSQDAITCPEKKCQIATCDGEVGCQYSPKCVPANDCETSVCNEEGECVVNEVVCDTTDKCLNQQCYPTGGGCRPTPKNCITDYNPCTNQTCVPETGECNTETIPSDICNCECETPPTLCQLSWCNVTTGKCEIAPLPILNEDLCFTVVCDDATGAITMTPKVECSGCSECQAGVCVDNNSTTICDDLNMCTIDTCTEAACAHTIADCDDDNPCTVDTCDSNTGCVHTPTKCPDAGKCQVGVCNKDGGCGLAPRVCNSTNFCTQMFCDDFLGCVSLDRDCPSSRCASGYCNNVTQECEEHDYDPAPFVCRKGAVISTGVIAGIVVAAAIAAGLAVFGGKKGYDYWKTTQNQKISGSISNPMYELNPNANGDNPLYGSGNAI
eukprot:gene6160-7132_t